MKKVIFSMIFIVYTLGNIKGQILDYYPMHKGDVWAYSNSDWSGTNYYKEIILDVDTLENGDVEYTRLTTPAETTYYLIKRNEPNVLYYRYPRDWEYTIKYKINVPINSYWEIRPGLYCCYRGKKPGGSFFLVDTIAIYEPGYLIPGTDSIGAISRYSLLKGIGLFYGEYDVGLVQLLGCIVGGINYGVPVGVENEPAPNSYELTIQNYPNPFNNQTVIQYTIPENEFVKITMYDMLGREIETLVNEVQAQGKHVVPWQVKGLSSGVYFAVLKYQNKIATQKIIYQK